MQIQYPTVTLKSIEVDFNSLPFYSETVQVIESTQTQIQDLSIVKSIKQYKNEYEPQIMKIASLKDNLYGVAKDQFDSMKYQAEEFVGIKHEKQEEQVTQEEPKEEINPKKNEHCEWYEESLEMKTLRFAGFFQDWREWYQVDPVRDLSIDEALKLYGLGSQAREGNNNTPLPSLFDIQDRLKWNAWNYYRGKSRKQAATEFVDFARSLLDRLHVDYYNGEEARFQQNYYDCMKKLKENGWDEQELGEADHKFKTSSLLAVDEGIQESSAQYGTGFNLKVLMGLATLALLTSQ